MKVMIVSSGDSLLKAMKRVFVALTELTEADVVESNHETALQTLLVEEPDRIIIWEYDESGTSRSEYIKGNTPIVI